MKPWRLERRASLPSGEIAYDVIGAGPPVVLVHGTPSRSFVWRRVAAALASEFSVYVFDLLGFGDSERGESLDISLAAQARVLAELIDEWGLSEPTVAGHDIGGGVVLRAHLLEDVPFSKIALVDAVVLRPWITPTTRHVKAHLDTYRTMPTAAFEAIIASHLRSATHKPMDETAFAAYFEQWRGAEGQRLYLRKDELLDEDDTAEFEPLLGSIRVPVRLIWGEHDAWLNLSTAKRLRDEIPGARLDVLPDAGHFCMEDDPDGVSDALLAFLSE